MLEPLLIYLTTRKMFITIIGVVFFFFFFPIHFKLKLSKLQRDLQIVGDNPGRSTEISLAVVALSSLV